MRSSHGRNAVLAAAAVVLTTAAQPAMAAVVPAVVEGRLVALRSLGAGEAWAEQMNERGDIVGGSADAAGEWQPVIWRHGCSTPTVLPVGPAA